MSFTETSKIISYLPAELHKGKEIYIDYYVIKPGTNKLFRKKIKVNRIKSKISNAEFTRYCRVLTKEINDKLAYGWNPFLEQEAGKGYTDIITALELFQKDKFREMTDNSIRSYKSFCNMFLRYLDERFKDEVVFCININRQLAVEYLSWCWNEKEVSGKTYNGYIKAYHSIWSWFVENSFSKVNVFQGIKPKKEQRKKRVEISIDIRKRVEAYCKKNNMESYWLMCELCFYCLIRPVEMTRLQPKNVNLKKQIIVLEQDETKNQNERIASVPSHIIPLLKRQLEYGSGKYLFSDNGFWTPGMKQIDERKISKKWAWLRKPLEIPKNVQFYSQRDSGIIYLMDCGINPEYVRSQADHYSLTMTTTYSNHYRPEGIEQIKDIKKAE
jgi:integrase